MLPLLRLLQLLFALAGLYFLFRGVLGLWRSAPLREKLEEAEDVSQSHAKVVEFKKTNTNLKNKRNTVKEFLDE